MANVPGIEASNCWQLGEQHAQLNLGALKASIDPMLPAAGLGQIAWEDVPLPGKLLGIAAGEEATTTESFTRGSDLIVSCAAGKSVPFQWQVYWRGAARPHGIVQIDAIVSLQTGLLESFPTFTAYTSLTVSELWRVGSEERAAERLDTSVGSAKPASEVCSVLLRCAGVDWSYLEMTHPADEAETTIHVAASGEVSLERRLGGRFLEKGVIRRMRIRGTFLPREDDLETAAELSAAFCKEEPPLTT